ncbi:hypothetical protein [Nonomuraea africana]|uniref:hypothetical protein n=1 Tax=Nonomuraea africana TaxID=46171 RepID=UPI0033C6C0A6
MRKLYAMGIEAVHRHSRLCNVVFISESDDLSDLLAQHGLRVTEYVRQADSIAPALWRRSDSLRPADLCRLARATVRPE